MLDAAGGALDPAVVVHVEPIKQWATAFWDGPLEGAFLEEVLDAAARKLRSAAGSPWPLVAGPATAVIATAQRLGWEVRPGAQLRSDDGETWDMRVDPPAAIAVAVGRAVRRWRLRRIVADLPALAPPEVDPAMAPTRKMDRRQTIATAGQSS